MSRPYSKKSHYEDSSKEKEDGGDGPEGGGES